MNGAKRWSIPSLPPPLRYGATGTSEAKPRASEFITRVIRPHRFAVCGLVCPSHSVAQAEVHQVSPMNPAKSFFRFRPICQTGDRPLV